MFLGIDYNTWWFLVVGGVFTGYAILDGFDLGAGSIHLFFNKEESRRIALNAIGPVWDGNEVWLVIGGGTLFAGFPKVYAAIMSGFYLPIILFLLMLIFRAVSIEFRSKEPMAWWRKTWDISYCVSSTLVAFLLGVVLGNVMYGIPLNAEGDYTGGLLNLLGVFPVLVGCTTVALFMMHGAIYLVMKTEGRLYAKLTIIVRNTTIAFIIAILLLTFYVLLYIPHLSETIRRNTWLFPVPVLMVLAIANITRSVAKRRYMESFISSAFSMSLLLVLVALELYPTLVFNRTPGVSHLTIYNAASSQKTLGILLIIAAIGTPLVLTYTGFVFKTFKGKVKLTHESY